MLSVSKFRKRVLSLRRLKVCVEYSVLERQGNVFKEAKGMCAQCYMS